MRQSLSLKAASVVAGAFMFAFVAGTFAFSQPLNAAQAADVACVVSPAETVEDSTGLAVFTASLSDSCQPLQVNLVAVDTSGAEKVLSSSNASVETPAEFRFGPVPDGFTKYEFKLTDGTILGSVDK